MKDKLQQKLYEMEQKSPSLSLTNRNWRERIKNFISKKSKIKSREVEQIKNTKNETENRTGLEMEREVAETFYKFFRVDNQKHVLHLMINTYEDYYGMDVLKNEVGETKGIGREELIKYNVILKYNPGEWYTLTSNYHFLNGKSTGLVDLTHSSLIGEKREFTNLSTGELKYFRPLIRIAEDKLNKKLISKETLDELEKSYNKYMHFI